MTEVAEQWAENYVSVLGHLAPQAVATRWVDQSGLEAMTAEVRQWAERPDAVEAIIWCQALGWPAE